MPNAGRIIMYTSGCPKNQNKWRNKIGSPPPEAIKNVVPKLRSVSSIVIAPAKTGRDNSSRKAVISIAQTNSGIRCSVIPGARMLNMVVIKFAAPSIDDAPAR